MQATPTFVIGIGREGVNIVRSFHERTRTQSGDIDAIRSICIDTDSERLAAAKEEDLPTVYLDSDSHILSEDLQTYPFLYPDISVPEEGTNGLRHVGRYKLDSAASPTVQDVEEIIGSQLRAFFEDCATSTVEFGSTANVVVVTALGDGTGSGALPLLTSILDRIVTDSASDRYHTRLLGIGIVPPLDITPMHDNVSEPVSYLNTHGGLSNLEALLDTETDVRIPIYGSNRDEESETYSTPGKVYNLEGSPFEAFWLVSHGPAGIDGDTDSVEEFETTDSISRMIESFSKGAFTQSAPLSENSPISPLGTIGYGAVSVPHDRLREFCELRSEREDIESELDEFVVPKIESLRQRRGMLKRTLHLSETGSIDTAKWIDGFGEWIGEPGEVSIETLVALDVERFKESLDEFAAQTDQTSYYRTLLALQEFVTEGQDVSQLQMEMSDSLAGIRQQYDTDTLEISETNGDSSAEGLETAVDWLEERRELYQRRLDTADPEMWDLLPPMTDLFTSEREWLRAELERVETDLNRLEDFQHDLETLQMIRSICAARLEDTRAALEQDVDQCQREIQHFEEQRDKRQEELGTLKRRIASLRDELTTPQRKNGTRELALSWEALEDVSESTVTELTSIQSYLEAGLLRRDIGDIESAVLECLERSQTWPDALSRFDQPVAEKTTHRESFVRYHEDNKELVNNLDSGLSITSSVSLLSGSDSRVDGDPCRIEAVSISHGGAPTALRGYRTLDSHHQDGQFAAMKGVYRDTARALAYPELHDDEGDHLFEPSDTQK